MVFNNRQNSKKKFDCSYTNKIVFMCQQCFKIFYKT